MTITWELDFEHRDVAGSQNKNPGPEECYEKSCFESATSRLQSDQHVKKKNNNVGHLPAHFKKMQDQLASQLSTRVIVKQTGAEKGEITILFFSNDDLDRISDLILQ